MRDDFDPSAFHRFRQTHAQIVIEARQDVVAPEDHRYLAAQFLQEAGKFDADIACANDGDGFWQALPLEEIVGIVG